jgi:DNA-binding HxlR family transcriptional regulator
VPTSNWTESSCSIARSLGVLGERWTFLILREALTGSTRFAQFRDGLGLAPDVLTDRLNTLVEYGVMAKEPYQEPGSRSRFAYLLTPAGRELHLALASLQQWGDKYLPWPQGPTVVRRVRDTDRPVHVGFVDDEGREVPPDEVTTIRTAAYPTVSDPTVPAPTVLDPTGSDPG